MTSGFVPLLRSVLHPTDLSEDGMPAFAHALAIALVRKTRLTLVHGGGSGSGVSSSFPPVRRTLEQWGLLEPGAGRADVAAKLDIRVTKVASTGSVLSAVTQAIDEFATDLVVLGTEGRDGLARFLQPSVAERIARRTAAMTLFVPRDGRGFVEPTTGSLEIQRILVPIDRQPDPTPAVVRATRAARDLGVGARIPIELLHVGQQPLPSFDRPEGPEWEYEDTLVQGDVIEEILRAGERASLIVMRTDGADGILGAFRGSHTERVVREATCPVLAIPDVS